MLRGYRCIVLAFGLILLGAGPEQKAQPPGSQTNDTVQSTIADISETLKRQEAKSDKAPDSRPCQGVEQDRESDLCAQWTAANAAQRAALWAEWALYVSIGSLVLSLCGLVALVKTLNQTDRTLRIAQKERATATRRAVSSSQETAAAVSAAERSAAAMEVNAENARHRAYQQLRPYLSYISEGTEFVRDVALNEVRDGVPFVGYRSVVVIKNFGQTPAKDARWSFGYGFLTEEIPPRSLRDTIRITDIVPGDTHTINTDMAIEESLLDEDHRVMHGYFRMEYTDTDGVEHVLQFHLVSGNAARRDGRWQSVADDFYIST